MSGPALTPSLDLPPDLSGGALRRYWAMERWRRRSRLIRVLRKALPAAMALVILLLAGWVSVKGLLIGLIDLRDGAASIHMTNARFFGRDGDGRAYVLGAAEAARDDTDLHRIRLRGALIALNVGSPSETKISSNQGVYRETDRMLRLNGDVNLKNGNGYDFVTDQAIIDTGDATVIGPAKVKGIGPTGTIAADSFQIFDQGRRVVFRGDVHSRIKQD